MSQQTLELEEAELNSAVVSLFSLKKLQDVLKYFEKLQELEVDGVEPTAHAFPRHNVWDQDESKQGFSASEALKNAPQSRQDQVVVPKVIEE